MTITTDQVEQILQSSYSEQYSFFHDFAKIIVEEFNDRETNGGEGKLWLDEVLLYGVCSGVVPQLLDTTRVEQLFVKHFKDLYSWKENLDYVVSVDAYNSAWVGLVYVAFEDCCIQVMNSML